MEQKDKELLLKDLCARLPYKVKCAVIGEKQPLTLTTIEVDYVNGHLFNFLELRRGFVVQVYISELKPYLFPLSSMTEEQKEEYNSVCNKDLDALSEAVRNRTYVKTRIAMPLYYGIDWLIANHFDYRGLIPMGLAIDATGLNIY